MHEHLIDELFFRWFFSCISAFTETDHESDRRNESCGNRILFPNWTCRGQFSIVRYFFLNFPEYARRPT